MVYIFLWRRSPLYQPAMPLYSHIIKIKFQFAFLPFHIDKMFILLLAHHALMFIKAEITACIGIKVEVANALAFHIG